ncbi:hypothetical protein Scep_010724 [Stephania cephalantha]|uniref:Kinesin motor domain-containing protein n=1 Tax=Stephania cephalantha TaxID=152367 RepID=A0AAP0JVM1_9MAGN
MKNYMLPRGGILRETATTENPNSTTPNSKQRSGSRKPRSSKENADPNAVVDVSSPMPGKPPLPPGKVRSPLPPRPPPISNPNPNPLKRKLSMETVAAAAAESCGPGGSDSGVKVIVRMRPLNKEEEEEEMIVQKLGNDSLSILGHTFTFDSVADPESSQQDIYQLMGAPLVENCLAGFNSSIFAYGQQSARLDARVFEQLFARIDEEQIKHADKQLTYQCRCSFLEIYNEQITDLLDPTLRNLQIREDVKAGVYVENLTEEYVSTIKDLKHLLIKGLSNRRTGATSINSESSRSHSVFTCVVESRCKSMADGLSSFRISRINLVDLAGSERQKLTGAAGERLREAGNINRSLSQLGNLINILAEVSQTGKQRHIPYRDSRLTFLLQESLGGNARLAMICAISPAPSCKSETFSTLRFAQRAKAIKNKAVVNEVTQDDVNYLREVIRQLKDELIRMKANGNSTDANGAYSTSWNARRSLNLLKLSLNRPMTLPHIEDDSDEEMEIDEEAVEKLCVQVGLQSTRHGDNEIQDGRELINVHSNTNVEVLENIKNSNATLSTSNDEMTVMKQHINENDPSKSSSSPFQDSEEIDVPMEDCQSEVDKHENNAVYSESHKENMADQIVYPNADMLNVESASETIVDDPAISQYQQVNKGLADESVMESADKLECKLCDKGIEVKSAVEKPSEMVADIPDTASEGVFPCNSPNSSPHSVIPSKLECSEVSPVLQSPTLSISPRVSSSRKSLRTLSMLSASQKDLAEEQNLGQEAARLSFVQPLKDDQSKLPTKNSRNSRMSTEHLAASLHRGLQIIDHHRQSMSMRSSFRFSLRQAELKSVSPVGKVDVGVQTLSQGPDEQTRDPSSLVCSACKGIFQNEAKDADEHLDLQLAIIDGPNCTDKSKNQVPKAVEKVLAGAIRREMALEEFCGRQAAEITQLNRLDKIIRLESLMDGVLPTEEFMEEELVSLRNEYQILKEKYENHPEVLRVKIELKRTQDELDGCRNYFEMGERDVLIEEIEHLRSQLQYYVDSSSSLSVKKRSPLLQLTYSCDPSPAPLCSIPESAEESVEDKFEQERRQWTETESKWISLADELRIELEESRSLAEKQKWELDSEKKCSQELKEAMQMAMQGHARILEQYAELQEKHIALLARHRQMQEGIEDVKKQQQKLGVKEKLYLMDENKGLRTQLRDTAEAVQAAGELLVRLKEAEEATAIAQNQAVEAEKEAQKAYQEINKLKKKHQEEITTLKQFLEESRLPKQALRPAYDDSIRVTREGECLNASDQQWRGEFEPFHHEEENGEFSRLVEPSWFSGGATVPSEILSIMYTTVLTVREDQCVWFSYCAKELFKDILLCPSSSMDLLELSDKCNLASFGTVNQSPNIETIKQRACDLVFSNNECSTLDHLLSLLE